MSSGGVAEQVPLPTRRLLALLVAAAPLFLVGAAVALAVDAFLLAAFLLDWSGTRPPLVDRETPRRLSLKGKADVRLEIRNLRQRRIEIVVTDDLSAGLERVGPWREAGRSARWQPLGLEAKEEEGSAVGKRDLETPEDALRMHVPPRSYADAAYRVRATDRGVHEFGDIHTRVRGPLGLAWRQFRTPASSSVNVQPGADELRKQRLGGLRSRLAREGSRRQRQWGEGSAFESLREYQVGDDPRSIDWKASARREEIIARRYRTERSQNVMIVIDGGRLMTEQIDDRERIDHALSAALLLTEAARAHGDRVGVMVFDEQVRSFLPPATPRLARIADLLAGVEPRFVEPNYPFAFTYLARHLKRRSLVVVFTDVIDRDASAALLAQLARSAASHVPLIVALRNPGLELAAAAPVASDADAFRRAAAEEMLRARAVAMGAMKRAGVLVVDAEPGQAIPETLSRYLEVKRRGML